MAILKFWLCTSNVFSTWVHHAILNKIVKFKFFQAHIHVGEFYYNLSHFPSLDWRTFILMLYCCECTWLSDALTNADFRRKILCSYNHTQCGCYYPATRIPFYYSIDKPVTVLDQACYPDPNNRSLDYVWWQSIHFKSVFCLLD